MRRLIIGALGNGPGGEHPMGLAGEYQVVLAQPHGVGRVRMVRNALVGCRWRDGTVGSHRRQRVASSAWPPGPGPRSGGYLPRWWPGFTAVSGSRELGGLVADTFVRRGVGTDQVWYTIDDSGACVVVSVGGRIDAQNGAGVCDALSVASGFSSAVVVDLAEAEFAEATAAGRVVSTLETTLRDGTVAGVVGPPEPVGWLLGAADLDADIGVYRSVDEAVAALSRSTDDAPPPP